jgi:hypothetical protein
VRIGTARTQGSLGLRPSRKRKCKELPWERGGGNGSDVGLDGSVSCAMS